MRRRQLTALSCGFVAAAATAACTDNKGSLDADGDGFTVSDDCDDGDPNVHPLAYEICGDGIDNNCDGVDVACLVDNDLDGYTSDVDCDDFVDTINPGAVEDCRNGYDDNCDGISTDCVDASLVYAPTTAGNYDAHGVGVFADFVIFGDPGGGISNVDDGRAVLFGADASGEVSELDADLISAGAIGETGAYGIVVSRVGADLCISADYQANGASVEAGKSWCYTEAAVRGAVTTLDLADAAYTVTGEASNDYATVEDAADINGDGYDDLLVYTAHDTHVIFGDGTPFSGDLSVPSDADLSLGGCASSTTGWCGFAHALEPGSGTLFLSEESGGMAPISLFDLPVAGTTPTLTTTVSRQTEDSATALGYIGGAAFGDSSARRLTFVDAAGNSPGMLHSSSGVDFGYWSTTVTNLAGHELLLVSDPHVVSPPGEATGYGLVYVFDLDADGLPSTVDDARQILVPPEDYVECGWRVQAGIVHDADGGQATTVVLSCLGHGGAAYRLDYAAPPPPPVGAQDIFATGAKQYSIRRWVAGAYTSRIEWLDSLAATEAISNSQGNIVGWRLHGIAVGSPLFRAGLRSNDIVRVVNGQQLSSAAVVNELYQALQKPEVLTVGITRSGVNGTMTYSFVP
ncbi:Type IV fimbrial biogenesis protein PilY1 [Enhygromyxa salina]|uniref:Type IV fimbrial biogenesis protein PilY1 n=1 Tax=Enhygromyxa salina TaxID=215803 RepID=A0A0C2CQT1_9BACT|nr:MopE-related protein [Enhygromyxa salina]KIG13546.1 Type IV fimbrial biogenesis protein PilY1 [Enhygromyxa salina]